MFTFTNEATSWTFRNLRESVCSWKLLVQRQFRKSKHTWVCDKFRRRLFTLVDGISAKATGNLLSIQVPRKSSSGYATLNNGYLIPKNLKMVTTSSNVHKLFVSFFPRLYFLFLKLIVYNHQLYQHSFERKKLIVTNFKLLQTQRTREIKYQTWGK